MSDFTPAIVKVLEHEGGYTPGLVGDPGGETHWGISKAAHPTLDIKNLTKEQAVSIYRTEYWNPLWDGIPDQRVANSLMDFAVNAGTDRAVKTLQRALERQMAGPFAIDGIYGPSTAQNVSTANQERLLKDFTTLRLMYYAKLNKPQFYESWFRRALDV